MSIQSDQEIVSLLKSGTPILKDFSPPTDWAAKDSLVQPASLDLRIGKIFVPPKEEPKVGQLVDERVEYVLEPGQAIVVETAETVNFPNNIAAFGFPPTSISNRAILMTNPGHIDPGFKGKLSFTLINMGREVFLIKKGMPIVTLLVIKLENPAKNDFAARNPTFSHASPTTLELNRLGRDFLDLDQRARKAAETIVRQENFRMSRMGIVVTVLTALLTAGIAFGAAFFQSQSAVNDLKGKISVLEKGQQLESRVKDLETKVSNSSPNANSVSNTNSSQNQGGKKK
jgi:deoxycytidine triphosphate deaminase